MSISRIYGFSKDTIEKELEEAPEEVLGAARRVLNAAQNLSWATAAAEEVKEMHVNLSDAFGRDFSDKETRAALREMKKLQKEIEAERPAYENRLAQARAAFREVLVREDAKLQEKYWPSIGEALRRLRVGHVASEEIDGRYAVEDEYFDCSVLGAVYGKDSETVELSLNGDWFGSVPFKIAAVAGYEIHDKTIVVELGSASQSRRNFMQAVSWGSDDGRESSDSEGESIRSLGEMKQYWRHAFSFGDRISHHERFVFGEESLRAPDDRQTELSTRLFYAAAGLAEASASVQKAEDVCKAVVDILGTELKSREAKDALEEMREAQRELEDERAAAELELREAHILFRKENPGTGIKEKGDSRLPLGDARLKLLDGDQDIGGEYFMDEDMILHALGNFLLEGFEGEILGLDVQPGNVIVDLLDKNERQQAVDFSQRFGAHTGEHWRPLLRPRSPRPGPWPPALDSPEDRAPD